jgi:hypothetical protein
MDSDAITVKALLLCSADDELFTSTITGVSCKAE